MITNYKTIQRRTVYCNSLSYTVEVFSIYSLECTLAASTVKYLYLFQNIHYTCSYNGWFIAINTSVLGVNFF